MEKQDSAQWGSNSSLAPDSPPGDGEEKKKILLEGTLKKAGKTVVFGSRRMWKARYFWLFPDMLVYARKKGEPPVGGLPFQLIGYVVLVEKEGGRRFDILAHSGRQEHVFNMLAKTSASAKEWVDAINAAMNSWSQDPSSKRFDVKSTSTFWKNPGYYMNQRGPTLDLYSINVSYVYNPNPLPDHKMTPILKALLKKKGNIQWKPRWCELYENAFVYFRSYHNGAGVGKPKCIYLFRVKSVSDVMSRNRRGSLLDHMTQLENPGKDGERLELILRNGRRYLFDTSSRDTCLEWLEATKKQIQISASLTDPELIKRSEVEADEDDDDDDLAPPRLSTMGSNSSIRAPSPLPPIPIPIASSPTTPPPTFDVIYLPKLATLSQVKGATPEKIIDLITPESEMDLNTCYVFLQTYRSIMSAGDLLKKLEARYGTEHKDLAAEIQNKVLLFVKILINEQWEELEIDVQEELKTMLDRFTSFSLNKKLVDEIRGLKSLISTKERIKRPAEPSYTLRRSIEPKRDDLTDDEDETKKRQDRGRQSTLFRFTPSKDRQKKDVSDPTYLAELSDMEIAKQLCLIDFDYYRAIRTKEFLKCAWTKEDKREKAPNIVKATAHFEVISSWVQLTILSAQDVQFRAHIFRRFLDIAQRCEELNNFNSFYAIYAALGADPIIRLKKTRSEIGEKAERTLYQMQELFSSDKNFSRFRGVLNSAILPCIPYLGLFLNDVFMTEEGNKDFIDSEKRLVNFFKRSILAERIRFIKYFQQENYDFEKDDNARNYLLTQFNRVSTLEEHYLEQLSFKLEKPNLSEVTVKTVTDASSISPPTQKTSSPESIGEFSTPSSMNRYPDIPGRTTTPVPSVPSSPVHALSQPLIIHEEDDKDDREDSVTSNSAIMSLSSSQTDKLPITAQPVPLPLLPSQQSQIQSSSRYGTMNGTNSQAPQSRLPLKFVSNGEVETLVSPLRPLPVPPSATASPSTYPPSSVSKTYPDTSGDEKDDKREETDHESDAIEPRRLSDPQEQKARLVADERKRRFSYQDEKKNTVPPQINFKPGTRVSLRSALQPSSATTSETLTSSPILLTTTTPTSRATKLPLQRATTTSSAMSTTSSTSSTSTTSRLYQPSTTNTNRPSPRRSKKPTSIHFSDPTSMSTPQSARRTVAGTPALSSGGSVLRETPMSDTKKETPYSGNGNYSSVRDKDREEWERAKAEIDKEKARAKEEKNELWKKHAAQQSQTKVRFRYIKGDTKRPSPSTGYRYDPEISPLSLFQSPTSTNTAPGSATSASQRSASFAYTETLKWATPSPAKYKTLTSVESHKLSKLPPTTFTPGLVDLPRSSVSLMNGTTTSSLTSTTTPTPKKPTTSDPKGTTSTLRAWRRRHNEAAKNGQLPSQMPRIRLRFISKAKMLDSDGSDMDHGLTTEDEEDIGEHTDISRHDTDASLSAPRRGDESEVGSESEF